MGTCATGSRSIEAIHRRRRSKFIPSLFISGH